MKQTSMARGKSVKSTQQQVVSQRNPMFQRTQLNVAVLSVLAAASVNVAAAELEEVVVTATKRESSLTDIPVTVQAIGKQNIQDLNIKNFDDYVRYLPNVAMGGRGPGQSEIYIRGMAIDAVNVMLAGAQGSTPNVAVYLDEQPITSPGRNLDVYTTDIERIEVLPGPQGTLFGASSQAGTLRLITRKPEINKFESGFQASTSSTYKGEMSNTAEGYINLPLLEDKLAVRAVLYNANEGGYIDNVYGSFTPDPAINSTLPANDPAVATYESANNVDLIEADFNDTHYKGFRVGAKYLVNDNWSLLVQHMQQTLATDGVFDYDPSLGDLKVQRFFTDTSEDSFNQTSWTLEGRMGALQALYTGAYLDREIEQTIDYTGYNNVGGFIAYYTCTYDAIRECLDPTKGFLGTQDITRSTHEFRIATPADKRLRLVAGVFMDDVEIETQDDYLYVATPELGFAPNAPISSAENINPDTRPPGIAFFNDITRTEEQIALFGELTYDLTDQLSATLGLRYYELEVDFEGSSNFANGPFLGSVDSTVEGSGGRDYDSTFGHSTSPLEEDDVISKFTLSYLTEGDQMMYVTYSEGFRPGGFNRGGGAPSYNATFPTVPVTYETDEVKNYELGWKAVLDDGRLRLNGSAYFIDWTGMQTSRFDPINVSILTFIDNAADSEITGLEFDLAWVATDQLTVYSAFAYNDTELVSTNSNVIELAPEGSELALTPKYQFNIRLRYGFDLGSYPAYWQMGVQHADDSYSSIVAVDRREQDGYTNVDLAFGISRDEWSVEIFGENMTDERAELFHNVQDDIPRITTNRPRTIGLRISYQTE